MAFDAERPVYDYLDRINTVVAHRLDGATRVRYVADVRRRIEEGRAGDTTSELVSRRVLADLGEPEELVAREVRPPSPRREVDPPAPEPAARPVAPGTLAAPVTVAPAARADARPPAPAVGQQRTVARSAAPDGPGRVQRPVAPAVGVRRAAAGGPPADPYAPVRRAVGAATAAVRTRSAEEVPPHLAQYLTQALGGRRGTAGRRARTGPPLGLAEILAVVALTVGVLLLQVVGVVVGLVAVARARRTPGWVKACSWLIVLIGLAVGTAVRSGDGLGSVAVDGSRSYDLGALLDGAVAGAQVAAPVAAAFLVWRLVAARGPAPT